jgi:hypothetical protein
MIDWDAFNDGYSFVFRSCFYPGRFGTMMRQKRLNDRILCDETKSRDFEDAIRNAISLGGDSDTLACITGGIAEAYYAGVPQFIVERVWEILDQDLKEITRRFMEKYVKYWV